MISGNEDAEYNTTAEAKMPAADNYPALTTSLKLM
jgi:hypothetical protein